MKKSIKTLISAFLCIALIFSFTVPAFASKGNNGKNNKNNGKNNSKIIKCFDDVKENHWAYKYIMWMWNEI